MRTRRDEMRLPRRVCGACAIAVAVLLTATGAAAQPSPPTDARSASSEARAHFDRGVSFYEETDYAAALVEFKRAYTLSPTWQVLFNIGQSYFQVRRYAEALVTLTHFLEEGQDRIPEPRRSTAEAERADLANRVGHARISSNVAGARVTIDDTDVGVTPLSEPTLVSVGVRMVRAVTPGNAPVEQEVSVPAGETVEVHLDFPEAAPAPSAALSPLVAVHATSAAPGASAGRGPAFAAFGVAIAAAATGGVFGALVLHDKSRLESECSGRACAPGSRPDIDAVSRDGTISTVAFGVAAAGLVVGTVLWLTEGGSPVARSGDRGSAVQAHPVRFGPGFVGGSF